MSAMISRPQASPCSSNKYSFTHITMWSLNVPLITWWRRSGDNSSWISARGKSEVNGCNSISESFDLDGFEKRHLPRCLHEHQSHSIRYPPPSYWWGILSLYVFADGHSLHPSCRVLHRIYIQFSTQNVNLLKTLTSGTILAQLPPAKLAPGNRRYKVRAHISLDENVHPDI